MIEANYTPKTELVMSIYLSFKQHAFKLVDNLKQAYGKCAMKIAKSQMGAIPKSVVYGIADFPFICCCGLVLNTTPFLMKSFWIFSEFFFKLSEL